ncbi:tail completion protein gp17 [Stenotrophomonas bentonitica]
MIAPIFQACIANAAVLALFGSNPTRVYPFGLVEKPPARPYVVWQTIGGESAQYLRDRPDVDGYSLQIDVYHNDPVSLQTAARAIRDAIEGQAYVTRWGDQVMDPETKLYRYSFDVDWLVPR